MAGAVRGLPGTAVGSTGFGAAGAGAGSGCNGVGLDGVGCGASPVANVVMRCLTACKAWLVERCGKMTITGKPAR